jgi:hypothetical protein
MKDLDVLEDIYQNWQLLSELDSGSSVNGLIAIFFKYKMFIPYFIVLGFTGDVYLSSFQLRLQFNNKADQLRA